jgi:hypothetical protein
MQLIKRLFASTSESNREAKPPRPPPHRRKQQQTTITKSDKNNTTTNTIGNRSEDAFIRQKYLLVGCAQSGKRTLWYQIANSQLSDTEHLSELYCDNEALKISLYYQLVYWITRTIQCMNEKGDVFVDSVNNEFAFELSQLIEDNDAKALARSKPHFYSEQFHQSIVRLGRDEKFVLYLQQCHKIIPDGMKHFFQDLERLNPLTYNISHFDNIHLTDRTYGSKHVHFDYENKNLELILTSGHIAERVKWIAHFGMLNNSNSPLANIL